MPVSPFFCRSLSIIGPILGLLSDGFHQNEFFVYLLEYVLCHLSPGSCSTNILHQSFGFLFELIRADALVVELHRELGDLTFQVLIYFFQIFVLLV